MIFEIPVLAIIPISAKFNFLFFSTNKVPFFISSPLKHIFSFSFITFLRVINSLSPLIVSSCFITAFAPFGIGAPVIILTAVLLITSALLTSPAKTLSITFISLQPLLSSAIIA